MFTLLLTFIPLPGCRPLHVFFPARFHMLARLYFPPEFDSLFGAMVLLCVAWLYSSLRLRMCAWFFSNLLLVRFYLLARLYALTGCILRSVLLPCSFSSLAWFFSLRGVVPCLVLFPCVVLFHALLYFQLSSTPLIGSIPSFFVILVFSILVFIICSLA